MNDVSFRRCCVAVAVSLALGLALMACRGDEGASPEKARPGSSARPATTTPAGSLDVAQAVAKLQGLQSFRFDIAAKLTVATPTPPPAVTRREPDPGAAMANFLLSRLGDFRSEGAVRAPGDVEVKLAYAGTETRFVQTGLQAWVTDDSGVWRTTNPASLHMSGLSTVGALLPPGPLTGANTKSETMNGVRTLRYTFDKAALERSALLRDPAVPASDGDVTLDVWLTETGVPVKLLLVASGDDGSSSGKVTLRLEVNLRNLNDASIQIKPPV